MTITQHMEQQEVEHFDEQIGMRQDPEDEARKALRKYQEEQGMKFDDPDTPVGSSDNYVPPDEDIPGSWMGAS